LWDQSTLPHALEQFFEQGGKRAIVVRVVSDGRAPSIDLPAGDQRLVLLGICPGTHEFLRVSVDYDGISARDDDLFNLVVQRVRVRGSELVEAQEIFRRVSILRGSASDVSRVLLASTLVRVAGPLPTQRPDITRGSDPGMIIGYVECNRDGDDGNPLCDYDLIGSETRSTGLFALQGTAAFNFLYIPPVVRDADIGMSVLVVAARFCRSRHALLVVDPPQRWRATTDALQGVRDWPFHSADAVMFFPALVAMDRLQGRMNVFPPSAAAIGALLRGAADGTWRENADQGLLRPAASPALWVDRMQRAQLVRHGVNVLRSTRAPVRDAVDVRSLAGELANGPDARLLASRRLALLVAASIERGTRWVVIEGNTARSRERVRRQVEQFLAQLAESGAFAGVERSRHYFVLCDERLNGPLELADGCFRLVFGYQSAAGVARQSWLVEHRPASSLTRPVSLNQLASLELSVR
jgi:hypothetical protein